MIRKCCPMVKYTLLLIGLVFALHVPSAYAQTSVDTLLLRIEKLILEMQLIKKEVEGLQNGVSIIPASGGGGQLKSLTQSLEYGETNSDIEKIQKLLATDAEIYAHGVASGFFGPKTEEAIKNLQARFGLDAVGAIGPATKSLLEGYFAMYPNGNYPADLLKKKPQAVSVPAEKPVTQKPETGDSKNPFTKIEIEREHGEAEVSVSYKNGTEKDIVADGYTDTELIQSIAKILKTSASYVKAVAEFDGDESDSDDENDEESEYDEDDAEDAIKDAEDAIENAEDAIDEAAANGDDVDDAEEFLDEAEEYLEDAEDALDDEDFDRAVSKAEKAQKTAEDAEDEAGGSSGSDEGDSEEITAIEAEVDEGEAEITVEYENDDDYTFSVEEDKVSEIIEAVAEDLDIDEDEVEDLIEFDFGDFESIVVIIEGGEARVEVEYESGVSRRIMLDEMSENDLIQEIADELDVDEDDVEDVVEFEYDD